MFTDILFDYPPPIKTFVNGWRDVAERFCSGCWHDPIAGHNTAVDAKLGPKHFPCPTLWTLARVLSGCAVTKAEPKLTFVADAMHELGEAITAPDLEMVRWRHCSSAGLANYAAMLVDCARRRTLHDLVGRWQADALDEYEPVGDVANRVLDDLHSWQLDGTSLPEPPRVKRPPAIVLRPSIARPRRRGRRYPGRVRMKR